MRLINRHVFVRLSEQGKQEIGDLVSKEGFEAFVVDRDNLGLWIRLTEELERPLKTDRPFPVMLLKFHYFSTLEFDYLPESGAKAIRQ